MDRALASLGRLIFAALVVGLLLAAWDTWSTWGLRADPWLDPRVSRWGVRSPVGWLGQDVGVGLLALGLVFSWWRATRAGPDGQPARWGARRADVPRPTEDPLVDLLGGAPRPPSIEVPGMDPEAGGDHVERWNPEDGEDGSR